MAPLSDIRTRDLDSIRCAECGERRDSDGHTMTLDECEANLIREGRRRTRDGRLCRAPEEHHEFVPGDPDPYPYDGAGEDRHALIGMVDELVGALACAIDSGPVPPEHNTLTARGYARSILAKYAA